jgi:hypothetical protein
MQNLRVKMSKIDINQRTKSSSARSQSPLLSHLAPTRVPHESVIQSSILSPDTEVLKKPQDTSNGSRPGPAGHLKKSNRYGAGISVKVKLEHQINLVRILSF